jgi:uncharacterized membrane protein
VIGYLVRLLVGVGHAFGNTAFRESPEMPDSELPPPSLPTPLAPITATLPTPASTPVDTGPSDNDAGALIGISFDEVLKAQEFLLALNRLSTNGEIKLRDAAVVVKDLEGKVWVRETLDPQPGRAALSGATWSGLLGLILGGPVGWIAGMGIGAGAGAVAAKFIDVGIPDEWVTWFKEAVQPQTATIVALLSDVNVASLVAEARRFDGARVVHTTLTPSAQTALAHAFDGEHDSLASTPITWH